MTGHLDVVSVHRDHNGAWRWHRRTNAGAPVTACRRGFAYRDDAIADANRCNTDVVAVRVEAVSR